MIQSSLGDVGLGKFRLVKFVEFTLPNQLFKTKLYRLFGASNQVFEKIPDQSPDTRKIIFLSDISKL